MLRTSLLLLAACGGSHAVEPHPDGPPGDDAATGDATTPPGPDFVTTIDGADFVRLPEHAFDLGGKTIRYTPAVGGYTRQDVTYAFDSAIGTELDRSQGTTAAYGWSWRVTIPFSFNFGGTSYTQLYANTGGNLTFGAPESTLWSQRDPWADGTMRSVAAAIDSRAHGGAEKMIAALWAVYEWNAHVYVKSSSGSLLITWKANRPAPTDTFYAPLGQNVFQARLYSSGAIDLTYQTVPEHDGIVGVFPGVAVSPTQLDSVSEPGDTPYPDIDIQTASVHDAGSAIELRFQMAQPIPSVPSATPYAYRVFLDFPGAPCQMSVNIGATASSSNFCGAAPRVAGYHIAGNTVSIYLSKISLDGRADFSWSISAEVPGVRFDNTVSRPVHIADLTTTQGNTFDVFHYPVLPKDAAPLLRSIYGTHPANDDIALLFTDFRSDDLFGHGGGAVPLNVAIQGIGPGPDHPGSGADYGSNRLQMWAAPTWVGQPRFARDPSDGSMSYHHYALAVGWLSHELVHRFGIALRFLNPQTGMVESLTDPSCHCHWADELNAPSIAHVSTYYADSAYSESSIMGGGVWNQTPGGGYQHEPKPYLAPTGYSALDLYIMGLMDASEVPDTFLVRNNLAVPVRISDVVAAEGARMPSAASSQHAYTLRTYVMTKPGMPPDATLKEAAEGVSEAIANHFHAATDGRMMVTPSP